MNRILNLSPEEILRLEKLLNYSYESISYWFNSCDSDEELINENNFFIRECLYFLNKIKE
ncbi:hypothetical protein [Clostridium sp. UBA7503]|uniref:hypothetical protein n=1 Tax=Clostridium sp. UBA7503 TaxID=1946377 RepID=UPI00321754DF